MTRDGTTVERASGDAGAPFPPPVAGRLRAVLTRAHAETPFSPADPRAAARRTAGLARSLGLSPTVFRGGLDIGGAELDHVWVVADERVLDTAFPLLAERFVELLRRYVAGDLGEDELEEGARPYPVPYRVIGAVPERVRYRGAPVWSAR